MSTNHRQVIVIGSGPAGLTAALYTARAELKPLVFEGSQPGGQLTITTEVENYPGFPQGVMGPDMMDLFREQAKKFGAETMFDDVTEVDLSSRPFVVKSSDETYTADSIIIATGASAKLLGLPGEKKFMGYGVSACATCDGFFFKDMNIAVIGGGDTAMEEANYLTKFAKTVTLIHRREEFRASRIMLERVQQNPKITFLLNTVVEDVLGKEVGQKKSMTGLRLRNVKTNEITDRDFDGLFLAIGHQPNTSLFEGKLELDKTGYIITKGKSTATNIPGVFACGDVQDPTYRQAVTAAGSGCAAAIDAGNFLLGHA